MYVKCFIYDSHFKHIIQTGTLSSTSDIINTLPVKGVLQNLIVPYTSHTWEKFHHPNSILYLSASYIIHTWWTIHNMYLVHHLMCTRSTIWHVYLHLTSAPKAGNINSTTSLKPNDGTNYYQRCQLCDMVSEITAWSQHSHGIRYYSLVTTQSRYQILQSGHNTAMVSEVVIWSQHSHGIRGHSLIITQPWYKRSQPGHDTAMVSEDTVGSQRSHSIRGDRLVTTQPWNHRLNPHQNTAIAPKVAAW